MTKAVLICYFKLLIARLQKSYVADFDCYFDGYFDEEGAKWCRARISPTCKHSYMFGYDLELIWEEDGDELTLQIIAYPNSANELQTHNFDIEIDVSPDLSGLDKDVEYIVGILNDYEAELRDLNENG